MMGKISLQDLSGVLVERWHIGKKEASAFVNEMFFVIQKSLDEDKIVKVKGLGTFKIIDVDDRESVDVNTGDRVLIEGHGKITFTPDALMKELVNKPFSQFETVVLNDGVDFKETIANQQDETANDNEDVEDSAAPLVEFVDAEKLDVKVESEEPEPAKQELIVVETPKEKETPSEEIPEKDEELDTSDESEVPDEPEVIEEESAFKKYYKWIGIALLILAVGVLIGYLMGNRSNNHPQTLQESSVETVEKETAKSLPVESDSIKEDSEVEEETQKDEDVEDKKEIMTDASDTPKEEIPVDKYETMDARVRTGAYRIIGTDEVVKARAGDNLTRICRRTIGPGMECYLEVYNGLSSGVVLTAGQEIKIPKLELKKKKKK